MDSEHGQVVIVGGGMAGGLLAALLARQPHFQTTRITLLDAGPAPQAPDQAPATRVSSLTLASYYMLQHAGAWAYMPASRVQPYSSMAVWDADGTGRVDFDASQVQQAQLGWLVENDAVTAALYQCCQALPQVTWRCQTAVRDLRFDAARQSWQLVLSTGESLHTTMLVGADGARSAVRAAAGIAATPRDTGHRAIVATINTERPHGACARQRFIDTGPLALLPLFGDGHQSSIVWSLTEDVIEQYMTLEDAAFCQALSEASEHCLGQVVAVSPRQAFPIYQLHASEYVKPGLALIGDAAHVVHPLAGQGVNLGMLDAGVLAEEMGRAQSKGLAPMDASVLARYQRRRRGHNLVMQNAFLGLKQLFEQPSPVVRFLRNAGLGAVNRVSPVKDFLTRQALGVSGDVPDVAKAGVEVPPAP